MIPLEVVGEDWGSSASKLQRPTLGSPISNQTQHPPTAEKYNGSSLDGPPHWILLPQC